MYRRYRLYAKRPGGRLTTDRIKYEAASNSVRMEYIVRAKSMREARQAVRERDWADGPGKSGLLRIRKGLRDGNVEFAPYLEEQVRA